MTVETTGRKSKQSMTGSIVNYDFPFRALVSAPGDIKCIRTITATNTDEDMTRITEIPAPSDATDVLSFLVSVATDGIGGTITVAWPSTACTLTIYRETTDTQSSDYEDYNQFPADTVETDLDKRTLKSQEQEEDIARSLKYPITAPTGSSLPLGESDKYIGWDTDGVLLENKTLPAGTLVQASTAQAIAHTENSTYITPFLAYESAKTMGSIEITTEATIATGIVTSLTATTLTISGASITPIHSKTLTVEDPGDPESITFFYVDEAITVEKIICVLTGTLPSILWGVNHDVSRTGSGTSIVTGTTTDVSSGSSITSFADATIPADSHIWFVASATSGTIDSLSLTLQYTRDA